MGKRYFTPEVFKFGYFICETFDSGEMVSTRVPAGEDPDFDSLFYFAIVSSSVINLCPEQETFLGRFIREYDP